MDELVAKFLPQFKVLARSRMAKVNSWMARRDQTDKKATLREIHSIKGDAGMLELKEVASFARDCEEKVKLLHADSPDADIAPVAADLHELERLIESLEVPSPPKHESP
jgi:HPt (histidine-containing phosphotransfer) domain-containing protein